MVMTGKASDRDGKIDAELAEKGQGKQVTEPPLSGSMYGPGYEEGEEFDESEEYDNRMDEEEINVEAWKEALTPTDPLMGKVKLNKVIAENGLISLQIDVLDSDTLLFLINQTGRQVSIKSS